MIRVASGWAVLCTALLMASLVGCNNKGDGGSDTGKSGNGAAKTAYHPKHGPGDGHLLDVDAEDFGAQWHQSSKHNKIRIEFLDAEGKAAKPAKIDSVTVFSTSRSDGKSWALEAGERNADGEVGEFSLDDEELHQAMSLGIRVEFKRGEDVFMAIVPAHEPHLHD
ncbi:MAG TPA: hypothetical protein PKD54_08970 [Pirellulaceae bacterium]|nr:hypothetical protein [Pirellulaceae bacterium]